MTHQVTHKGKDIFINYGRGFNERYFDVPVVSNNFKRVYHKGHVIDAQKERFEIIGYMEIVDAEGDKIPFTETKQIKIPVTDASYDELYQITSLAYPALQEMNLRAINGLLENTLNAQNFFAFDPVGGLQPFQSVEFELDQSEENPQNIIVSHTDGSGTYQYSLDKGATWGNNTILQGLTIGEEYEVSVKDNTSNWFRTKKIKLV